MITTSPISGATTIHIEGMDLAGKSTATSALEHLHPGCTVRHNALTAGNRIFELADQMRRSVEVGAEVLGPLYVAATIHDFATYVEPGGFTIQDSTIVLRSIAFNTAIGSRATAAQLSELLEAHPRFSRSLVLTASIEARLGRLEQRYRDAPHEVAPDDLAIRTNPGRFLEMEAILIDLAERHFDAYVIDTTELTRDQVMTAVTDLTKEPSTCAATEA